MRVHKGHFERLRRALAASVVALLAAAPALASRSTGGLSLCAHDGGLSGRL
jgi:hypothetical protein